MPNGLMWGPNGSLVHIVNGKIVSSQPPLTNDPWRPANVNITPNGAGYRKVSQNGQYYWKVVKGTNGKWKVAPGNKTKYYVKNGNKKFRVAPELK